MDKFLKKEHKDFYSESEDDDNKILEIDISEFTQAKERKMLFDRGFSDNFEKKQESKIFAVRKKAYNLKERINNTFISEQGAKIFVKNQITKLKSEWPAIFANKFTEIYVHVDLDSFYASVETISNPSYKNKPLAVGSINMIAACNYKAREYGVRSGMPGYQAKELCPEIVICKTNFDKYNYYSELVMEILSTYDPKIEIYGIDEACLIFTESKYMRACQLLKSDLKNEVDDMNPLVCDKFSFESVNYLIQKIRNQIHRKTSLTISAGISVCRGLAKFASKVNKPNGQYTIESDFDKYLLDLQVDEINGIGKFTKELLNKSLDIKYIKDLRSKLYPCSIMFTPKTFDNLLRLSFGLSLFDNRNLIDRIKAKSKSHGIELSIKPITLYSEALFYLWNFSNSLESRISKSKRPGMTVTLSIKYSNFDLITKRRKTTKLFEKATQIFDCCIELLKETFVRNEITGEYIPILPIRMLGLRVSDLVEVENNHKLHVFPSAKIKYKERECVICGAVFINETDFTFQIHVNKCIDIQEQKNKEKVTLTQLFRSEEN